ncbi:MAG: aspartate carbamoyltransferase catalytic subunit [Firmicutes bacterium]|nr:aspartate carbamoyltransferase catalytic subunit [Bacillota bacterium]
MKDLLGIKDLDGVLLKEILDEAKKMRAVMDSKKRTQDCKHKNVVNVFYENSTRTAMSFEIAGKTLGATVTNMSVSTSSVTKGENMFDTVKTLESIGYDTIVVRHGMAGVPYFIAKSVSCSVINAGDGRNEHPTQALLDMRTMLDHFKTLKGLKVAIIGDIAHSRVAMSNLYGLTKLGADVYISAPNTLLPHSIEKFPVKVTTPQEAVKGANIVMTLRLQLERMASGLISSTGQYAKVYGLCKELILQADKNAIIMHPGPVNRGIEMTSEILDGHNSVVNEQVTNGVAVRMAVLKMCKNNA